MTKLEVGQERRRGGQSGNSSAAKHGLNPAKAAITRFGSRAINKRKKSGVEWKRLYVAFAAEVLGEDSHTLQSLTAEKIGERLAEKLGQAQAGQVELLATELWTIRKTDAYIINLDSPINKKGKTLLPIISQRNELVATYEKRRRDFHRLRLHRVTDDQPQLEDMFRPAPDRDEDEADQ